MDLIPLLLLALLAGASFGLIVFCRYLQEAK